MMTGLQGLFTEPFQIPLNGKNTKIAITTPPNWVCNMQYYLLGELLFIYFSGGYNLDKCNQELELQKLIYSPNVFSHSGLYEG